MWIWDKERNLWLYILGFSSDYGAGTIVTLTHFDIWNDYEICEVSEKDFQSLRVWCISTKLKAKVQRNHKAP